MDYGFITRKMRGSFAKLDRVDRYPVILTRAGSNLIRWIGIGRPGIDRASRRRRSAASGGGVPKFTVFGALGLGFRHGSAWEQEGTAAKAIAGSARRYDERNRAFRGGTRVPSSDELERR